jgi:hypothetical protein
MATAKRTSNRPPPKTKRTAAKAPPVDVNAILEDQLSSHPIGKALSAIDTLYKELDDMQMRLDILISRINILKKRTSALRQGELITLNTMMSAINGKSKAPNGLKSIKARSKADGDNDKDDDKVEWTKLKLLEETTINDVLLASETVVSIESQAAAKLVEQGVAEVIEMPTAEKAEEKAK